MWGHARKLFQFSVRQARLAHWLCLGLTQLGWAADTNTASQSPGQTEASGITNLLAGFQVKPGFKIELAASEPMITRPVAMAFDENGRLFVAEMRDLGGPAGGVPQGRIRVLDGLNDKGVFENSTIYADKLAWPSALACYAGGVFVAAGSEILYLKDAAGNGVADTRQVVLSGFGGSNNLDSAALVNNFNWGSDNRIHGVSAGIGGEILSKGSTVPVSINGSDFSFDPRTLEVIAETGPAQSGLSFDSHGRKFVCDYLRPLMTPRYELRYFARDPYYVRPPGLAVVADPSAPVYRFLQQPTQAGAASRSNFVQSPLSSCRGLVIYRGRAFPTNYFDNAFVADPDAHVVHRLIIREDGLDVAAQRSPDETRTEFLISRDSSFRPAQLVNGPDGALYIADMQDNPERGRIYRIVPSQLKRSAAGQLGRLKTYELVSMLAQGDGWHRDTAARLLYERKDPAAPALLRGTLNRSRLAEGRILALHALAGAGALSEENLLQGMRDSVAEVRRHSLMVAEALLTNGGASAAVLAQLRALAADPAPQVRYQLAFIAGELRPAESAPILAQVLGRDLNVAAVRAAVLSCSLPTAATLFDLLARDTRFLNDAAGIDFLEQLALATGASGQSEAVEQIISFIGRGSLSPALAYAFVFYLGEGLHRTRSSVSLVDTRRVLQNFYSAALNVATDPTQPDPVRVTTARLLGVSPLGSGDVANWLLIVCTPPTSPGLQMAGLETLRYHDDAPLENSCLDMWGLLLGPVVRTAALTDLLARAGRVPPVLDAIQSGKISASDLSSAQRNYLRSYPIPALRLRALQLLGPIPVSRPDIMQNFKPALTLRGIPDRGRGIFRQRCLQCHRPADDPTGIGVGPDLLRARTLSREQLMARIIQPNVGIRADYSTRILDSKEGESLMGIISDENRLTITLTQLDGTKLVWPQLNINSIRLQSWSLMPEGLEIGMSAQDMSDLMEFVVSGGK